MKRAERQFLLADLKTCTGDQDSQWGRIIHARALETMNGANMYVLNAVMNMYCKCGCLLDARILFDVIQRPDVVSWNTLLIGYAVNGDADVTLHLLSGMKASGCTPDAVTYVAALKACTSVVDRREYSLKLGRKIHAEIGCHLNSYLQNALIDMYSKCGSLGEAQNVFDSIVKPDVVAWTALLLGYAEAGEGRVAVALFFRMNEAGCFPDPAAYIAALKACTSLAVNGDDCDKKQSLEHGRLIHSKIRCVLNDQLQNTLVDMYCKSGSMVEARCVFDNMKSPNVVSWNTLISGYAENGEGNVALDLFSRMKAEKCTSDSVTYISVLKACTSLALTSDGSRREDYLEKARGIHAEIGCHMNHYLLNTLIDMYANFGSMVEACKVFDIIQNPDVVSWNALLLGYVENGEGHAVLDLFYKMKAAGYAANSVTYIAALKACALIGALSSGRKLHSEITEFTSKVVTCIVDFYAKCGSIVESRKAFDLHSKTRSVSTWNALLAGYSRLGDTGSVLKLFEAMQDEGLKPNGVTFVCLLLCCSHAGLVQKAREYFEAMPLQHQIAPSLIHYTCMIDALGRGNQLNEAIGMIKKMPFNSNAVIWMTLLGACCKWKNVDIGKEAFEALTDIDKTNASPYVLMAQIYGSTGMLEDKERILQALKLSTCMMIEDSRAPEFYRES